jgi:hypothetical protein
MRTMVLLPVACLALLAGPASAQQPTLPPGPAEAAPPPPPAAEPSAAGQEMRTDMHAHPGMARAPALRVRFGGISLDLRCSVGDDTEACARTALGIIDHLSGMSSGGGTGQGEAGDQGSGGDQDQGGADQNDGGGDQ